VAAPTTLDDALMQRQPNDHWSVDKFDCSDNGENLAQAIQQGTATAISDGSYQSGRGTSAFILRGNDCTKRLLGVNTVPGLEDTQSAYRSELAGVAGSLAILAATCRIHHITDGEATIGLDGEQALKTASGDWPLNAGQPDFDLLCDIRTKIESLPITLKWKWIEGHQDDNVKFEDLDPLSQDNVLADSLAKAHLNQLGHDYVPSTQRFGDEGWSVRFAGKKLARVDLHTLYSLLYTPTTEAYWMKKYQLSRQLIRSIDWAVCGEAYRQLRFPQQRRVSKQATGHMAVGKMMQIWSFQETAECPRCQAPTERASHVLTCRDPRADAVWKMALTKLERWMTSQRTMPQLQTAILNGLSQWRDPTHLPCPSGIQDIRTAVALQDTIGWYPFATGHMGYLWKGIQQQYYAFLGRRNTGKKWARELIKKLWGVAWDMWEHRNDILHNSDTPAKLRRIAQANLRIEEEFDTGIEGLLPRDKHWILQPMVQVLRYDLIVKAQWLESVALARERFKIRRDASHEIMRNQRELMAQWLLGGTSAVTGET
jgi:ribonuclease HI